MIVRRAESDDIDGICAVAEAVRFDPEQAQSGGFLVYMHGAQGYASRLAATDLFFVALVRGEVAGFILCFEDHVVQEQVRRGILVHDLLRAQRAVGCTGRWVYCDQIAIRPDYTSRGVGIRLVWEVYRRIRRRDIDTAFVAVLHEPLNIMSKAFCESLGFALRGTVRYADGRLWGLYARDVPRKIPVVQLARARAHGLIH